MNARPQSLSSDSIDKKQGNFLRLALIVLVAAGVGFALMAGVTYLLPGPPGAPLALYGAANIQDICNVDGYCDTAYENASNCPQDCAPQATEEPEQPPDVDWVCGNGICETEEGEGVWNCSQDCSWCGDNVCRPEEVDTCCGAGNDCTVSITCGDGICSACESNANCPTDCDEVTISEEPPTATNTLEPVVDDAGDEETEEPEETATPTEEPEEDPEETPTPSETPTETATPTDTPTPEPDAMGNCRIVNESSIPEPLIMAADANDLTGLEGFIADLSGDGNRLWVICDEAPETVCLPARDVEVLEDAHWLDCASSGPSCADTTMMEMVGSEICVSNSSGNLFISCAEGCTIRMDEEVNIQDYILPLIILLLLLALIIMLLFLMLSRRNRGANEDDNGDEDDYGPETVAL